MDFSKTTNCILVLLFISMLSRNGMISSGCVCVIVVCTMFDSVIKGFGILPNIIKKGCLLSISLFTACTILNLASPLYLIKYLCYIIAFVYGFLFYKKGLIPSCNKYILYSIILIPVFIFVVISQRQGGGIFDLANTYVYYGLSVSLLYYFFSFQKENSLKCSWLIILLYILSATKLGILFAIILSLILFNTRTIKQVIYVLLLVSLTIAVVFTVNIPIFERLRGVYELASNIPLEVYFNIGDSSTHEIGNAYSSSVESDTSFVFRLIHWSHLLTDWFSSDMICQLFGHGDMYAHEKFGLQPHNEYVKLLVENGLFIFIFIILFVGWVFKYVYNLKNRVLLFAPFTFMLTENILYFSIMNMFIFLVLGFHVSLSYYKSRRKQFIIKDES